MDDTQRIAELRKNGHRARLMRDGRIVVRMPNGQWWRVVGGDFVHPSLMAGSAPLTDDEVLENETHVCAVCFAPPGVECNSAPGWCGAVDAGPHARVPMEDPCGACRGTGRYGIALAVCPHCQGNRHSGVTCFELAPGPAIAPLLAALEGSGMRWTKCEGCGCALLTRGDSNKCPPCRDGRNGAPC
jgi:hypothetical protein